MACAYTPIKKDVVVERVALPLVQEQIVHIIQCVALARAEQIVNKVTLVHHLVLIVWEESVYVNDLLKLLPLVAHLNLANKANFASMDNVLQRREGMEIDV